jgi:hypothetical protein
MRDRVLEADLAAATAENLDECSPSTVSGPRRCAFSARHVARVRDGAATAT